MTVKKTLLYACLICAVITLLVWAAWVYVRGEHAESFTFDGLVIESTFPSSPTGLDYVEVYHDGDALVLVTIEQPVRGTIPYPVGTQIGLILKDYEQFGGSNFKKGRYRITLDKYVQDDNFEYWQCSAKRLPGA